MLSYIILVIINLIGIECRCGYPELPYMANSIVSKDYFEEGEKLSINCMDSIAIGQTMKDHVIQCRNNTWNSTALRCTRVHNITDIDMTAEDKAVVNKNSENQEFVYISDNDPMTCVMLKDNEKWVLNLGEGESKYVSNVAIIATVMNNNEAKGDPKHMDITVSLPNGQLCQLKETEHMHNSAMLNLIYNCAPYSQPTEKVSIQLNANQNEINICGVEVFTLVNDDCGKPETPLYSYANQMRIQNDTKIAEYVCAKGYEMTGPSLRTCGHNGLWTPARAPICLPEFKCDRYEEVLENFTFVYKDLDMFGNAIPDVSSIIYHCVNRSEMTVPKTEIYCQTTGNWTEVDYLPECHPRAQVVVVFGHHFLADKHLIYYGSAGLVLLFVGSFIMLFHIRRLAKKIAKQMREKSYRDQDKALPNYSNEANYQDLTNLFVANDAANQQAIPLPAVQQTDQKY